MDGNVQHNVKLSIAFKPWKYYNWTLPTLPCIITFTTTIPVNVAGCSQEMAKSNLYEDKPEGTRIGKGEENGEGTINGKRSKKR